MTIPEAIKLIHPDSARTELVRIEKESGVSEQIRTENLARRIACECMELVVFFQNYLMMEDKEK